MAKKLISLLVLVSVLAGGAFAQSADIDGTADEPAENSAVVQNVETPGSEAAPAAPPAVMAAEPDVPLAAVAAEKPKEKPLTFVPLRSDSILPGQPPQSTTSRITLDVIGTDVDNFLSTTSFQDVTFDRGFSYAGFDHNSLSVGVSRKFLGALTSLYYNGNIIEDVFAIMANNPNSGEAGIQSFDGIEGSDYNLFGMLRGNTLDSRTNVGVLFGKGNFGIKVGYTQILQGYVQPSSGMPVRDGLSDDAVINLGKEALLDNTLAPSVEAGLRFDFKKFTLRANLAAAVDFHSGRTYTEGGRITLTDYFADPLGSPSPSYTYEIKNTVTAKTLGDYMEPAAALRLEFEFPTDERSRLALGFEGGAKMKLYSNTDDKGNPVTGKFSSTKTGEQGTNGYAYSVTEITDMAVLARPSVRYITQMTDRLTLGLNGGMAVNFKFGEETEKHYVYDAYSNYLVDAEDISTTRTDDVTFTRTRLTGLDLGIRPNLGIGLDFMIVPEVFSVSAGVGAEQTLFQVATGTETTTKGTGAPIETPILEQTWGKPTAKLALGAQFRFSKRAALDAMFSATGIELEDSNFVLQFSARF